MHGKGHAMMGAFPHKSLRGAAICKGNVAMIKVDVITVNLPEGEVEMSEFGFDAHNDVAACVKLAAEIHPDYTSMVIVILPVRP